MERNRLTDNGDGVTTDTEAHDNQISRNAITGTGFFGFPEAGGFGIIVDGVDDNTVERNLVVGGRGEAILVTSFDEQVTADRNLVSRNVANSKLSDGILVNNGATATLIERNTANRSGDDGIDVDAAGTKLTRNTANRNHDLGIEAVPASPTAAATRPPATATRCSAPTCSATDAPIRLPAGPGIRRPTFPPARCAVREPRPEQHAGAGPSRESALSTFMRWSARALARGLSCRGQNESAASPWEQHSGPLRRAAEGSSNPRNLTTFNGTETVAVYGRIPLAKR